MNGVKPVPLIDLTLQYETLRSPMRAAIDRVLERQQFVLGSEVDALENELAAVCEVAAAVGCASGSDALLLALLALGVAAGDEVLCPAFSFFATAGSIARLGARPVFVDIDPATYNMDPEAARRAARACRNLKAILPVHLYGQAADLEAFLALGTELDVPVVEDAAQAIGARDSSGRKIGGRGRVACFSFFPTKNLGAYGDGGLLTTQDPILAARLRVLRVHGSSDKVHHHALGLNSRLDELQAAVLRVKLPHLEAWSKARCAHAAHYDHAFAAAGALPSSEPWSEGGFPLRTPQPAPKGSLHVYNQYVIRVPPERRDPLREHLRRLGIGSEIYYRVGLHQQECFAFLGYRDGDLPETERAARETLALPVFPELSADQRDSVVDAVTAFLRPGRPGAQPPRRARS